MKKFLGAIRTTLGKIRTTLGALALVGMAMLSATPAHAAYDLTTFTIDASPVEALVLIILGALGGIWAGKYLLSFMRRG